MRLFHGIPIPFHAPSEAIKTRIRNAKREIEQGARPKYEQSCIYCGCTDDRACEGGCWWIAPGICSRCGDTIARMKREDRRTFAFACFLFFALGLAIAYWGMR